jgi:hypothetical protein
VVRKDLLHRIKKGNTVPTFVLEFLLARYCASDEPAEIQAGMEAVLATLRENYVRPDESNAAQSRVAMKGKYKFIDKVHVRYVEKEKRHWASLENFASQRIAIGEWFYRDNDRLLEGGIWAEVTIAHNDIDADNYAFYVEDLRPIQLSRFDLGNYGASRGSSAATNGWTWYCARLAWSRLGCLSGSSSTSLPRWLRWRNPTSTSSNWGRLAPASPTSSRVLTLLDADQRRAGGQVGAVLQQCLWQDWVGRLLAYGGVRRSRLHQD